MQVSKKVVAIVVIGSLILFLWACVSGMFIGPTVRNIINPPVTNIPVPTATNIIFPTSTYLPAPTQIPQPTPTIIPPTLTATPTVVPVYVQAIACDKKTIDYIIDNNGLLTNFNKINKEALSHFNFPPKVDKGGYNDIYLKFEKLADNLSGLNPPAGLSQFQSDQTNYLYSMAKALKQAQKGDASEAWSNLYQAQYYQSLMNADAGIYTCGYPLAPAK